MGSINEFKDLFRAMVLRNCNGDLLKEYTKNDKLDDYVLFQNSSKIHV